jgi:hypothetical protein
MLLTNIRKNYLITLEGSGYIASRLGLDLRSILTKGQSVKIAEDYQYKEIKTK